MQTNIEANAACGNCWGHQEYEDDYIDKFVDVARGRKDNFISKFVKKYIQ